MSGMERHRIPIERFFEAAAETSGFSVDDLTGPGMSPALTHWRKHACVLALEAGHSWVDVAVFCNRSPRTVAAYRQHVHGSLANPNAKHHRMHAAARKRLWFALMPPLEVTA